MRGAEATVRRGGATLIELLIVLVIIAILAGMALYRTTEASRRANLAVLRSDLRSLTILQEAHQGRHQAYGGLEDLGDLRVSDGVALQVTWHAPAGYAATGTHVGVQGVTCGVFRGPAAEGTAGPATEEGVITCQ